MLNFSQIKVLEASPLFAGLDAGAIVQLLLESGAAVSKLGEGEAAISQGERQSDIFVLLSGAALGEKLTADGRSVIISEFAPGQLFGEMLSGASVDSPVTVRMTAAGEIIRLPLSGLLGTAQIGGAREAVTRNLLAEISEKYMVLLRRLDILLAPTLRAKILSYLQFQSEFSGNPFTVPHSREEQAQLLNCDRSALSRELASMKRDGVIEFRGREFEIIEK
ncbi:MAG: Crp/Fnr family transcriptional regulator [Oscillospiraceae bacterium]|jgi:CRP-like cAMP-binding protein|nr:Crp/Fnr family transcriptional regulator [Oscillospiraceae bacterium]